MHSCDRMESGAVVAAMQNLQVKLNTFSGAKPEIEQSKEKSKSIGGSTRSSSSFSTVYGTSASIASGDTCSCTSSDDYALNRHCNEKADDHDEHTISMELDIVAQADEKMTTGAINSNYVEDEQMSLSYGKSTVMTMGEYEPSGLGECNASCAAQDIGKLTVNGTTSIVSLSSSHVRIQWQFDNKIVDRYVIAFDEIVTSLPCYCSTSPFSSSCLRVAQSLLQRPLKGWKQICDCRNHPRPSPASTAHYARIKLFYARKQARDGYRLECLELTPHHGHGNDRLQHTMAVLLNTIDERLADMKRPKNVLMFVNPFGGHRKAPKMFEKRVKPIFELAAINVLKIVTERKDHAKDMIVNQIDLLHFDGIVCIGGDGTFAEILNGVIIKTQLDNRIDVHNQNEQQLVKPSIPLGIISAGSTNVLDNTVNGINGKENSILSIVLGRHLPIDVSSVHHRDSGKLLVFCANFMGYGFLGDTLLESESKRWMGPPRYTWSGLQNLLHFRSYCGELKMCIEPKDGKPSDFNPCNIDCDTCKQAGVRPNTGLAAYDKPSCILVRKKIVAINGALIACRCAKTKLGVSPMSHNGNGCTDLIVVEKCSRLDYLRYMYRLSFSRSNMLDLSFIHAYRVREFEFTPVIAPQKQKAYTFEQSYDDLFDENWNDLAYHKSQAKKKQTEHKKKVEAKRDQLEESCESCKPCTSVWNIDGEVLREPSIRVKVHCQLVTLFATGVDYHTLLNAQ